MFDPTDQQLAIQTILDVAGREGLKALQAAKGGTEVLIPRHPQAGHWMVDVFGAGKAVEISRRLSVFDARGHVTCGVRFYVGLGTTRLQKFKAQLMSEVTDALLSGMMGRDVAIAIQVSERTVRRQLNQLIADGRLLERPRHWTKQRALPAPTVKSELIVETEEALWEIKRALVDEALLKGQSNKTIATSAGVGRTYIRVRRKVLFAAGHLKPGRIDAGNATPHPSPDHSANVGEMVATLSGEVR